MQPLPARILFCVLAASAIALFVVTRHAIFALMAPLPLILLSTSLATSRLPLTRALNAFRNQPVEVRLWGAAPPGTAGTTLTLSSVNVIGAGTHLFFTTSDGSSAHLKIAQPRDVELASDHVTVAAARYVQWNATKLEPDTAAAVWISLT